MRNNMQSTRVLRRPVQIWRQIITERATTPTIFFPIFSLFIFSARPTAHRTANKRAHTTLTCPCLVHTHIFLPFFPPSTFEIKTGHLSFATPFTLGSGSRGGENVVRDAHDRWVARAPSCFERRISTATRIISVVNQQPHYLAPFFIFQIFQNVEREKNGVWKSISSQSKGTGLKGRSCS